MPYLPKLEIMVVVIVTLEVPLPSEGPAVCHPNETRAARARAAEDEMCLRCGPEIPVDPPDKHPI